MQSINGNIYLSVPEDVDSEIAGSISFMEEYERRYGCEHPLFLQGTLDEAVKEAFSKPAREVNSLLFFISVELK
jgi:FAS-associated factor 1